VRQVQRFVNLFRSHFINKGRKFDEDAGNQENGNDNGDHSRQDEKKRTYQGHPVSGRELSLFPNKRI
jgi:hypothetical protein